eukprot:scaffold1795_cov187-Alexandrium_tamarense.AAC.36
MPMLRIAIVGVKKARRNTCRRRTGIATQGGDDTGNEEASTFLSTQCRPLSSVCQPGLLGFLYARGKSSERNAKITYTRTLSIYQCRGIQLCCPAQQKVII